jgi:hypothetical protein
MGVLAPLYQGLGLSRHRRGEVQVNLARSRRLVLHSSLDATGGEMSKSLSLAVVTAVSFAAVPVATAQQADSTARRDPWAEKRMVPFGDPESGWALYEVQSGKTTPLAIPQLKPVELSTNPDGTLVVFTAYEVQAKNTMLFAWHPGEPRAKRIGNAQGWHGWPMLSLDQRWVYFSNHPKADGPPEWGKVWEASPQLFRVHPDGSGLEALTQETKGGGCNVGAAASANDIFYVQMSCTTALSTLVRRCATTGRTTVLPIKGDLMQANVSPDGKLVRYITRNLRDMSVWETGTTGTKAHALISRPSIRTEVFGKRPTDVLYEDPQANLWRVGADKDELVASLAVRRR